MCHCYERVRGRSDCIMGGEQSDIQWNGDLIGRSMVDGMCALSASFLVLFSYFDPNTESDIVILYRFALLWIYCSFGSRI